LPPYTSLGYRDNSGVLVNAPNLEFIRNWQLTGGLSSTFSSNTKISLEAFLKRYSNYPMLVNKGISLANLGGDFGWVGDEPATAASKGKTYGLEFSVQQKLWKNVFGILSYTWYRSLFTDTTGGYRPSSWDSRHVLNLAVGYKFKRNWELGIKWSVQGGIPYTPYDTASLTLIEVWDATDGNPVRDYTQLNTKRTKVLHAMNLRVDKKWFFKKWNLNIYLDITNLYNAKDVSPDNIDVVRDADNNPVVDPDDATRYQLRYINSSGSSVLPTIGVVIEL
jgi:Putative MetA-pathway of phenol degradation